jgi:hypothetical protein
MKDMTGIQTVTHYLRKMALNGYIINFDLKTILEPIKLMRNISNNVNQITARVNSTNNIYAEDITELKEKYGELSNSVSKIMNYFSELDEEI